jgi:hypothetical protein
MIIGFVGGVVLALAFYFLLITFLGPYLGLPPTAPKNATPNHSRADTVR